jgi:hypothetical protein
MMASICVSLGLCFRVRRSDAPAVSTATPGGLSSGVSGTGINDLAEDGNADAAAAEEQWDDAALASSSTSRRPLTAGGAASGGVLDYKSLAPRVGSGDGIAEKLRREETKAQLAAAREGMEREAQKLREEQERKEQEAAARQQRLATAASSTTAGGAKWLPPHLRAGGAGSSIASAFSRVSVTGGKLDVQNEELFPDLASADKILEQKEKEQHAAFKIPKKTPVGGGASWASKATALPGPPPQAPVPSPATSQSVQIDAEPPVTKTTTVAQEPDPDVTEAEAVPEAASPAASSESPAHASDVPKIAPKKKKKKDLSTFKPGS